MTKFRVFVSNIPVLLAADFGVEADTEDDARARALEVFSSRLDCVDILDVKGLDEEEDLTILGLELINPSLNDDVKIEIEKEE